MSTTSPLLLNVPDGFDDFPSDAVAVAYLPGQTQGWGSGGSFAADSRVAFCPEPDRPGFVYVTAVAVEPGDSYGFDGDYDLLADGLPVWVATLWLAANRHAPETFSETP